MKLEVIRIAIRNYDSHWKITKYFRGEQEKFQQLKAFAHILSTKDDDYELSSTELYNLSQIIKGRTSLEEIQDLKQKVGHGFMSLFEILEKDNLINSENIQEMKNLDGMQSGALHNFFHLDINLPVVLKPIMLETMLFLFQQDKTLTNYNYTSYIKTLRDNDALEESTILFLKNVYKDMTFFFKYIDALANVNKLTPEYARHPIKSGYYSVIKFLNILQALNVQPSHEIMELALANDSMHRVNEHLGCLKKVNFQVQDCMIKAAFSLDAVAYYQIQKNLQLLSENKLLDISGYNFIFQLSGAIEQNSYFDIFQALIKAKIFEYNANFIFNKLKVSEVPYFSSNVKYLANNDLLNQKTLMKSYKKIFVSQLFDMFEKYKVKIKVRDLRVLFRTSKDKIIEIREVIDIIEKQAGKSDIQVNYKLIKILSKMSERDLYRLGAIMGNLIKADKFSLKNFLIAANRISARLHKVEQTTVTVQKVKIDGIKRKKYTLDTNGTSLVVFAGNEAYASGSFGLIKQGFSSIESNDPVYNIKLFIDNSILHKSELDAKREVKYNNLFGRESYYIKDNDVAVMIAPWQRKTSMARLKDEQITAVPNTARLSCFIDLLSQINLLHSLYRVHQDIKLDNIIVNFKELTMRLVDFGTCHKRNTFKSFASTPEYSLVTHDSFAHDICATGLVAARLFEELYEFSKQNNQFSVTVKDKKDFSLFEQAMLKLINCMLETDKTKQCTSEDALQYCKRIAAALNNGSLSGKKVESIAKKTIFRTNMTVEDAIRGRLRLKG